VALSTTDLTTVAETSAEPALPPPGRRRGRFVTNGKAATGLVIIGLYALFAIIGPWIAPLHPSARSEDILQAPSAHHWLGTPHIGQDIFSQILVGTRSVMYVGFLAGAIATALSILVGVTSGYLGGASGESLSAFSNVFLVIPALPLIIIVTSSL